MLEALEVRTRQGALLTLPLENEDYGYVVQTIEGLDPVKATLVSSSFANMDGGQPHTSRREQRTITVKLELDPNPEVETVRDLRTRLYSFFMPKSFVKLRFVLLDGLKVDILAQVEDFEAPHFVQDPDASIILTCFDPDFLSTTPVIFSSGTTSGHNEVVLDYEGSVETGVLFTMQVNRALPTFTIYHRAPDGTLNSILFTEPLVAGDILRIHTKRGNKYVVRTRAGVESSVLYGMTPQSNWLELQPGENFFRVYAAGAEIPYSIEYTTRYGGI